MMTIFAGERRPLAHCLGLAALSAMCLSTSAAPAKVDWAGPEVQAVRELIGEGDWERVYEFCGQHIEQEGATGALFRSLRQTLSVVHLRLSGNEYYLRMPTDAGARGNAASMVGLYENAIQLYQEGIDTKYEPWQQPYEQRDGYAFQAARCALRLRDYARAVSYLNLIKGFKDYRWTTETAPQVALINDFSAAPKNIKHRLGMVESFSLGEGVPHRAAYEKDLRFLRDTLKLKPSRDEAQQVYSLMVRLAEKNADPEMAEQTLQTAAKEFRGKDFGATSALRLAESYASRDTSLAEACLRNVVRDYRGTYWAASAHFELAELACKTGDTGAMVQHLEAAAKGPADRPRAALDSWPFHPRYSAHARLADHYRRQGDYAVALEHYQEYEPQHFGGNALAGMYAYRDWRIAECLIALGKTDQALNECLLPRLTDDTTFLSPNCEGVWGMAKQLVAVHEERGTLHALPALMKPYLSDPYWPSPMAAAVTEVAQYRMWARDRDIGRLVAALKPYEDRRCWAFESYDQNDERRSMAAAEALASLGGAEVSALKKRYQELMAEVDPADPDQGYCHRALVAYALGVSRSPEARAYLRELLATAEASPAPATAADIAKAFAAFGIRKEDLTAALALQDTAE